MVDINFFFLLVECREQALRLKKRHLLTTATTTPQATQDDRHLATTLPLPSPLLIIRPPLHPSHGSTMEEEDEVTTTGPGAEAAGQATQESSLHDKSLRTAAAFTAASSQGYPSSSASPHQALKRAYVQAHLESITPSATFDPLTTNATATAHSNVKAKVHLQHTRTARPLSTFTRENDALYALPDHLEIIASGDKASTTQGSTDATEDQHFERKME